MAATTTCKGCRCRPASLTKRALEEGACQALPNAAAGERPTAGTESRRTACQPRPERLTEGPGSDGTVRAAAPPAFPPAAGGRGQSPSGGGVAPRAGASGGAWPGRPLRCGRPEAAVRPLLPPPVPRDGGPRRAGPLRGRLLAGAGLRRAGAGGAAGRRVRRRVLLRPAHLRGRHRHLPQPHLVGVLVRGQPGGAAGGAARRRGAGAAQGPRGQPAAGAGARPGPPPLLRLGARAALPRRRRRAGAAARPGPAGPPRRRRQGLLKTRLPMLLPLKVGKYCKLWKENSLLNEIGFPRD